MLGAKEGVMKHANAGRVQAVEAIATHYEPHPDECMAIWMAARFGRETFPGIQQVLATGRVLFCDAGREMPKHLPCSRRNILEIGVGGREFDEHRDGQDGKECAATLMASHLGLRDDPSIERMVQWTLANDQEAIGTAFDWSDIMKAFFAAGAGNMATLLQSLRVFDAVYNTLSGRAKYRDITGMREYWKLAADFVLELAPAKPAGDFSGPCAAAEAVNMYGNELISWILNYEVSVKGLEGAPSRTPGFMEIPSIVEALYRDGASVSDVGRFVRDLLTARLIEQKLFMQALDEWRQNRQIFTIEEAGVAYRVAVVVSENRRIVSAIRADARPHVIIRMLPKTGHISVFASGLDVTPIVKRLRAAAWAAVGNTSILPAERLAHEWTITEVPQLCFQKNAGNILNSSLTARGVPPVRLTLKTYISIVKAGLREVATAAAQHRKDAKRRSQERREARKQERQQA